MSCNCCVDVSASLHVLGPRSHHLRLMPIFIAHIASIVSWTALKCSSTLSLSMFHMTVCCTGQCFNGRSGQRRSCVKLVTCCTFAALWFFESLSMHSQQHYQCVRAMHAGVPLICSTRQRATGLFNFCCLLQHLKIDWCAPDIP